MPFTITVTNAGRAAIVNAANTGTNAVEIAQVGVSQTAITPSADATSLAGETKRLSTIAGDVVADDVIHLTMTDESADTYTLRSFGLYLADGTLFALYGQADPILEKVAASIAMLSVDVVFADIAATSITFGDAGFVNPPATTERQGVVELATVAEAQAGIDALRALTPQAARSAILGWLLAQDGAGSGLDADLLDGQQGSFFTDIPARLGFTPANRAGDTFTGQIRRDANFYIDLQTGNPILNFDAYDYLHFDRTTNRLNLNVGGTVQANCGPDGYLWARSGITVGGQTVWHAGNDGSGSGLDADLLDGLDSSYFVNIPARLGYVPVNKAGDTFTGLVSIQGVGLAAGIRCYNTVANRDYRVIQKDDGSLQITDETDGVVRFAITSSGTIYHGTTDLMWHSGNDGAGSGLDADLLDGRQASDFALLSGAQFQGNGTGIVGSGDWALFSLRNNQGSASAVGNTSIESINENGIVVSSMQSLCDADGKSTIAFVTTPAGSRTTDRRQTAAYIRGPGRPTDFYGSGLFLNGNPLWRSDNDGAGSGLDADLLDGQQGSWYADIIGRLGYAPVQQGTGIGQQSNAIKIGWNGSKLQLTVDTYDQGNIVTEPNLANKTLNVNAAYVQRNNNHLWGPDNDGAGSGLDADLLDGFQADAFARITAQSIGSTGYMILSNGLKIVYGAVKLMQDSYSYPTFPIAFENAPSVVFPTINTPENSANQDTLLTARTVNGFTVFQAADISNVMLPYIAIGL